MDKVRLSVETGYRELEIYEVYEYQVSQYNPKPGKGGLFVEYINTFLKLKAEANGYPGWVHSPEDKDRYVYSFSIVKGYDYIRKQSVIMLPNGLWPNSVSSPCRKN